MMDLSSADFRALHSPFSHALAERGTDATFEWLVQVLATQGSGLRAQNSLYVAFTGDRRGVAWLEDNVGTPVTEHWGTAAAILGAPWPTIHAWIRRGGPQQLMALDALLAYRRPRPNMSPIHQLIAPVLPSPPSRELMTQACQVTSESGASPRARKAVAAILASVDEVIEVRERLVPVERVPLVFLKPQEAPRGPEVLAEQKRVTTSWRKALDDLLARSQKK